MSAAFPPLPPGRFVDLPGRGRTFARYQPGPLGLPTVVLLHGWTVTADTNWVACYGPLSARYGVLAPDLAGHGRGVRVDRRFRLEDCADDVVALAEALGVARLVAVGYSMGGPVAALAAHRHPERVSGLVMCATAARFLDPDPRAQLISAGIAGLSAVARATPEGLRRSVAAALVKERLDALPAWVADQLTQNDPAAVVEAGLALRTFDGTSWLPLLKVAAAAVVTTADVIVTPARQRALADLLGASVHPVDGGHDVCVRAPQRFVPALLAACAAVANANPPAPT